MENINQLKTVISKLNEREAKALLSMILIRSEQGEGDQVIELVQSINKSLRQNLHNQEQVQHPQTVHILFGDSQGGSLKAAFRNTLYMKTEEIIVLPDILSVGPIESLHTKEGINHRFQWFKDNYRVDLNDLEEMKQRMVKAIEKIKAIPPYQQVYIWTGENAAEQVGLRFVLYLMQNKVNEVVELNTFKAFHEIHIYPALKEEDELYPRTSGELRPEELLLFYEHIELRPLNDAKRQALSEEGKNIILIESHLRTWDHGQTWMVNHDRDDELIIECANKLQLEQGVQDYIQASRLIGEVMGHMKQCTRDQWIEYRLRELISKGIFDYQGDLSAMRLYEVKLKKEHLTKKNY